MNSNEIQQIKSLVQELEQCEVCFESSQPSLILGDCGHSLCCQCLTNWLKQGNRTCPFCREKIISVPIRFPTKLANLTREAGKILGCEANDTNVLLTSQLDEIRKFLSPSGRTSTSSSYHPLPLVSSSRSHGNPSPPLVSPPRTHVTPSPPSPSPPLVFLQGTDVLANIVPHPPLISSSSASRPLISVSLPNQGWTNIENRCPDEEGVVEMEVSIEEVGNVSSQKKQLGELLFPLIHQQNPRLAHRITCLLLDQMRIPKIKELLSCPGILTWKIGKAIDVLRAQGIY